LKRGYFIFVKGIVEGLGMSTRGRMIERKGEGRVRSGKVVALLLDFGRWERKRDKKCRSLRL
jgi:hypothetical protein